MRPSTPRAHRRPLLKGGAALLGLIATSSLMERASAQAAPTADAAELPPPASVPGFAHARADLGEVQLHYVIGGQGPPVVLLHGWPQTWYAWHKVLPTLAEQFTVIAPDLRGLGDSSQPESGYTKRQIAEDVHLLVGQLGLGPISLVGHDWGAPTAYAYAALYPAEVRRLAMLAVGVPDASLLQVPLGPLLSGNGLWHFVFHAVRDVPELLVAGHEREYLDWFYHWGSFDYAAAFEQSEVDEYVRTYSQPESLHAGFEYYRAVPQDIEDNRRLAQTKLPMPLLFVVGDGAGLDYTLAQLKGLAENVHGVAIPNCGHWIATDRPRELLGHLVPFLTASA